MNCSICQHPSEKVFSLTVLAKYPIDYFACPVCKFVQTQTPFWLEEAYQKPINVSDIGLVSRNLYFFPIVEELLLTNFDADRQFLDYGGGYGLFVRMMRDKGFDFYREDKFCQNIFAEGFDYKFEGKSYKKFELITSFEVFEHLTDPIAELQNLLQWTDNVLFSTELQPIDKDIRQWAYLDPNNGQHISLFHLQTLQQIAKQLDLELHTNGVSLHLFTRKKFGKDLLQTIIKPTLIKRIRNKISRLLDARKVNHRKSLLPSDWQKVSKGTKMAH